MNKKRLSLYLDNKCNLKCSYCNVDYSKNRTFSDKDLLEWFDKNKEIIDMNQIKLCGGEPTLIYLSIFDFLDKFRNLFLISNFYNKDIIEKWVDRFNKKLTFVVSIHDEVFEEQFRNIEKYINYIQGVNIVVSYSNIDLCFEYIKRICNLRRKININLLPELPHDDTIKDVNYEELRNKLTNILNYIREQKMFDNLVNKEVSRNVLNSKMECDYHSRISIFLDGKIHPCVCNSPFFITFKNKDSGNKNNKYEDCKKCRKCTLYTCNDGYINNDFDYREFCFMSKIIYDFCIKEMSV